MTPFDSTGGAPLSPDSGGTDRHAQLVAAAVAAAEWARARRATWSVVQTPRRIIPPSPPAPERIPPEPVAPPLIPALPAEMVPLEPMPAEPVAVAMAPAAAPESAAPVLVAPLEAPAPEAPTEPAIVAPARVKRSGPSLAARILSVAASLVPPFLRWLPRFVVVALLVAAAMIGRPYWRAWRQRLTAPKTGVAVLDSAPAGSQVLVDGKEAGTTPLTTTLPAGPHTVEFRYRKGTRTAQIVVTDGGRSEKRVDWSRKPTGTLRVDSQPTGSEVLVDGVQRGTTPLVLDDEVEAGRHTVVIESTEGTVERTVTVTAGETADVNETIFAGWIKVYLPFDMTITERGRPLGLDDRGQVMLSAGTHEVRFENRSLDFVDVRKVSVTPGAVTTVSIAPPKTTLSVTSSTPGEVSVDGTDVGQTPLAALPLDLGTHDVAVKLPSGDQRRFTITATVKPVSLTVDFNKPGA